MPYGSTVSLGMAMPETGQRDSARQGGGRTEGQHGSCCENCALACLGIHILDIRSISLRHSLQINILAPCRTAGILTNSGSGHTVSVK